MALPVARPGRNPVRTPSKGQTGDVRHRIDYRRARRPRDRGGTGLLVAARQPARRRLRAPPRFQARAPARGRPPPRRPSPPGRLPARPRGPHSPVVREPPGRPRPIRAGRRPLLEGERAEGVQAVRLDPEVRVGEPTAERGRVDEQLQRAGDVAPPGGDEPEAPRSDALPARVTDLAAEGEGVLEARLRRVDVAVQQVELRAERLRPGLERGQAPRPDVLERLVEDAPRLLVLAAEQVEAAQHGAGEGGEVSGGGALRPGDGSTEELGGGLVVAGVAPAAPEDNLDPGELLVAPPGKVGGAGQGGLRALVAAAQELDPAELADAS